ncbi:hypothetical protein L0F63_001588 [Massospora cicadina]|nr:hypothetical protein L0F63_001588 [Massospora cicadina]
MVEITVIAKVLETKRNSSDEDHPDRDYLACAQQLEKLGVVKDYQIVQLLSPQPHGPAALKAKLHPRDAPQPMGEFTRYEELQDLYAYVMAATFPKASILMELSRGDKLLEATVAAVSSRELGSKGAYFRRRQVARA